jgi:predicted outer membrane repeat protein
MQSSISIVPSAQINACKWNACIEENGGAIYSTTTFLNTLTNHWCGIVIDDYRAVMALPFRKKSGIIYLYTPAFTQQLGLIGTYDTRELIAAIKTASEFAKYGDYFFNHQNSNAEHLHSFIKRNNYILMLNRNYDEIYLHFSTNFKRILKKEKETTIAYQNSKDLDACLALHQQLHQHKIKHVKHSDYIHLNLLCKQLLQEGRCICRVVVNENKTILSAVVLLKDKYRFYNLINVTTHHGKLVFANHFLMNEIIREFANTNFILDMEGSEIEGIKEFYEKLGAVNQPYFHWHFNHLSFPFSLFKR